MKVGQRRALEEEVDCSLALYCPTQQVDKGVVPLAGTNGETTTQGENCLAPCLADQPTRVVPLLSAQDEWEPPAPSSATL